MPEAVLSVSASLGSEHCVGALLTKDSRMQQVWKTLTDEGRKCEARDKEGFKLRLNSLLDRYRMEKWGQSIDGVSLTDRACASFFLATATVFAIGNPIVRARDIEKEVQRWRTGANLCREALQSPHRAIVVPQLAKALSESAAYFESWAALIETANANSPYHVRKVEVSRTPGSNSNREGNKNIRGQVCDVALTTREIFGSFLYGTVATAASVATGSPISAKRVENWCTAHASQ
jgi:hypothetical protein